MLRGNALAKVDEKGRLKVPSAFRSLIEPSYGHEFFVTSLRGESVLLIPLSVYSGIEQLIRGSKDVEPKTLRRLRRFINYYGQSTTMDSQGRVLIHPLLRESARIDGEVSVIGQLDYLEVWNRVTFEERLRQEPLTDADVEGLSPLGL